ncbi:MAG: glycosyltransferase family A protein [Velocimicrobium sp.]
MVKNKFVIFSIPFNNLNYNADRLTKEWITTRMDIFFRYTLKSLRCQTNQNFEAFLNCDGESMNIIRELLKEREELPCNIHFVDAKQITALINQTVKEYEYFYLVRIDSDNLYHKDFVQILYDSHPKIETEAFLCQCGYLFDIKTNKLAYSFHPSPSYYTLIYKTGEYQSGKRYSMTSHKKIITDFKVELLNDYFYITTITGENVLFTPRHMTGKMVTGFVEEENKMQTLLNFGLAD